MNVGFDGPSLSRRTLCGVQFYDCSSAASSAPLHSGYRLRPRLSLRGDLKNTRKQGIITAEEEKIATTQSDDTVIGSHSDFRLLTPNS